MERFDKIQRDREASNDDSIQAPAPTINGHHNGDYAKKRKAEEDEDSDLSSVESEPATKKVKKSKVKPEADSDAVLAAKLQAQYNAQARSTRGGGTKKKPVVKKEKKTKKKSAAKIGSDADSDVEGGASDDGKEKKGGFHVSTPRAR